MTTPNQVAEVAARLTKAQRAWLTNKATWRKPIVWAQERWMTFPPSNTHRVLMSFGLMDRSGQILDLGLAVRAHLEVAGHDRSTEARSTGTIQ